MLLFFIKNIYPRFANTYLYNCNQIIIIDLSPTVYSARFLITSVYVYHSNLTYPPFLYPSVEPTRGEIVPIVTGLLPLDPRAPMCALT